MGGTGAAPGCVLMHEEGKKWFSLAEWEGRLTIQKPYGLRHVETAPLIKAVDRLGPLRPKRLVRDLCGGGDTVCFRVHFNFFNHTFSYVRRSSLWKLTFPLSMRLPSALVMASL